jgi:hypothetical protein
MTTWRMPPSHGVGLVSSQSLTATTLRAGRTSTRRPASRSTMPVTSRHGRSAVAARTRSHQAWSRWEHRDGRGDRRGVGRGRGTAAIATCRETPKSRAAWATECSAGPTRRAISARALSVNAHWGAAVVQRPGPLQGGSGGGPSHLEHVRAVDLHVGAARADTAAGAADDSDGQIGGRTVGSRHGDNPVGPGAPASRWRGPCRTVRGRGRRWRCRTRRPSRRDRA